MVGQFTKVVTDELVEEFTPMVKRIAYEYSNKFRPVERDDIEQECWMWMVTHPAKIREWLALDNGQSLIAKSLRNAAITYSVKEKARIEGYHVDDLFWYSKDFIKELLPAVMSDDWKKISASEGASNKPASESGDWMAYATDIRKAFDQLSDEDKYAVDLFYVQEVDGGTLQRELDRPTIRAAEMLANRAVGKMVKFLGGDRPNFSNTPRTVSFEEEKANELD